MLILILLLLFILHIYYTCTHTCMYVRMYVCMHVCTRVPSCNAPIRWNFKKEPPVGNTSAERLNQSFWKTHHEGATWKKRQHETSRRNESERMRSIVMNKPGEVCIHLGKSRPLKQSLRGHLWKPLPSRQNLRGYFGKQDPNRQSLRGQLGRPIP